MCRIHRQANYLGQVVKLDECSRSVKNIHSSLVSIVVVATLSLNLWHSRLSHASLSRLQSLASQALFGLFFSSFNFHHSIFVTHHFKYYTRLAPSLNFHHSIFLTLFVGPIPITHCRLFFFFFFFSLEKKEKRKKKSLQ